MTYSVDIKFLEAKSVYCSQIIKAQKKYSYSTTNKMHPLSQIIYSCKTLYMFRTVFPAVIGNSKARIQQRYMSNSCYATGSSSCLTYLIFIVIQYVHFDTCMLHIVNICHMI
jgi:hypothetical protein